MLMVDGVEMVEVREAARMARRTPETIRRWVWSGRIAAVKQGNRLLVPADSIAELAGVSTADARQGSTADLSLPEWAEQVTASRDGVAGSTAADLIRDDRAGR